MTYSQGFHPIPRISFDDPLPLGMESQAERMWIKVAPATATENLPETLSSQLPAGLKVLACQALTAEQPKQLPTVDAYDILFAPTEAHLQGLAQFHAQAQWPFSRTKRKGQVHQIDLKECIQLLEYGGDNRFQLVVRRSDSFLVRPADVLRSVMQFSEDALSGVRVIKLPCPSAPDKG